ncbi:hypothetical protein [Hymenobacter crusticola]|uniref:Outer membrane lipoprotein-sorting protein n=1 Tax=Hymenobacter crusticola TaxID=1770526 RepID=A0A2C9ZV71_9BACT|nr:hypothetical protein [Hymenobacter crusticola]OUJ68016.1 hypothetical protein BXP70_28265 [Hymenobacter crusticola]
MKNLSLVMLALLTAGATEAKAQLSLDEICKKYIEKAGGVERLKNLSNVTYEQQLLSNNYEVPQKIIVVNNKAFYSENVVPGKKVVVCVVDNTGWQINPFQGSTKPKDLTSQELTLYKYQMNLNGPIYSYYYDPATKVDSLKLLGKSKVGKEDCYVINVLYKNKYSEKAYISASDFTLRRIESAYGQLQLSNYKTIGGVAFPFSKEMSSPQGSLYVQVLNIKTNQNINNSVFQRP